MLIKHLFEFQIRFEPKRSYLRDGPFFISYARRYIELDKVSLPSIDNMLTYVFSLIDETLVVNIYTHKSPDRLFAVYHSHQKI